MRGMTMSSLFGALGAGFLLSGVYGVQRESGAPIPPVPAPISEQVIEKEAHVLFAGDMFFDRYIREVAEREGEDYLFSCIAQAFSGVDVIVGNLEGPITDFPSISVNTIPGSQYNFQFTFPTTTATLLKKNNIGIVHLGNNHIQNFGAEGVHSTLAYLESAEVANFGNPLNPVPYETEINGVPLSFISYNEFGGDADLTIDHIASAKFRGFVPIVYTHWGEEYTAPPERVKALGRQFVDAGAEIVIGSHPHIIQEHEIYNGRHIYYSLGNFIFDQYFSDAVQNGLMLKATFAKNGVTILEEIPVILKHDGQTCPGHLEQ